VTVPDDRVATVLMPGRAIQHIDLAVSDVERTLRFYDGLLGPLGLTEYGRTPSYRGTEEVVYLQFGRSFLGIRPADGGNYRHYDVGLEHLAFQVDTRREVDESHERCIAANGRIESPPQEHYVGDEREDYYAFFAFDPDGFRIEVLFDGTDMDD
jgi:catechol 2,3-dioxygenase-like lactoylglutathione lyase family enzyme